MLASIALPRLASTACTASFAQRKQSSPHARSRLNLPEAIALLSMVLPCRPGHSLLSRAGSGTYNDLFRDLVYFPDPDIVARLGCPNATAEVSLSCCLTIAADVQRKIETAAQPLQAQ